MNLIDALKITGQYCLPKHALSRLVGKLAAAEAGSVTTRLIQLFINHFGIDMSEAEHENPAHYPTFNAFFTRKLKEGLRPVVSEQNAVALPVDGCVSQLGDIKHGRIIQAKRHDFSARELLGGDKDLSEQFQNGKFATIYLSPRDYHRIHMPCAGTLRRMVYLPGDLYSVNPLTAENVPGLFARNERLVCLFDTPGGPMAVVLVGATIVGGMATVWHGVVNAQRSGQIQMWEYDSGQVELARGAELGVLCSALPWSCVCPISA